MLGHSVDKYVNSTMHQTSNAQGWRHILAERRLNEQPKTLEDLSQIYGVSRERVRQIEARAFEKLRHAMLAVAANRSAGSNQLAA